jgi:thiopurine S-methyltransferase
MTKAEPSADAAPWRERWQSGTQRWDIGAPHRLTREIIALARSLGRFRSPGRVYIPGCGRAHDATVFSAEGCTVVGADFAPEAIAEAKRLYAALPGAEFVVEDALATTAENRAQFDAVFDRAMFCALDPSLRPRFAKAMAHRLKPGGVILSIAFLKVNHPNVGRPPFAVSAADMCSIFAEDFELVALESRADGECDEVIQLEMLAVFQVKPG